MAHGASAGEAATDVGTTHVALGVRDVDATVAFWSEYAGMHVVHRRSDPETGHDVVWLSDLTRPFVLVMLEGGPKRALSGWGHIGVGCASRDEVDARCDRARSAGIAVQGPHDDGPPVGYWAIIPDPDGHNLELSFGQDVGSTVRAARDDSP